jgi:hypothetical protein
VISIFHYLAIFYKVFYNALFVLRGLSGLLPTLPPFLPIIHGVVSNIATMLAISADFIGILFYPAFFIIQVIDSIDINLETINVTCEGAKAPAELFVNFVILGVVMSILMSGYQYLWLISFPNLTYAFLKKDILSSDISTTRLQLMRRTRVWWNIILCFLGVMLMNINPFEGIVRYLLTLVSVTSFFTNQGIHRSTKACNSITGMNNIDLVLSIASSLVVWWILIPFTYILSELLIPKCVLREGEILRLPHEEEVLTTYLQRKQKKLMRMEQGKFSAVVPIDNVVNHQRSSNPSHGHRDPFFHLKSIKKIQSQARWEKVRLFLIRYGRYVIKCVQFLTSIDILIISMAKSWLAFLGRRHGVKVETQLNSSDEEEEEERVNHFHHQMENDKKSFGWSLWVKLTEAITLQHSARSHDAAEKRIRYALEDLSEKRATILSTYSELCALVSHELWESELVNEVVAAYLAWSGLGHLLTRVGRIHWKLVARKYYFFLCGCFGIWTDDVVDAIDFETIIASLHLNNAGSKAEHYDTYRVLLYISVGMRAMIFQMIPAVSVLSVVVSAFASNPLFVFSPRLSEKLPSLLMWNAHEIAMEIHFYAHGLESAENMRWLLWMSTCSIFLTKSRLLAFLSSALILTLPVIALMNMENMQTWLLVVLVALFPFVIAQAIGALAFVGRQLYLVDNDFICCYHMLVFVLTFGMVQYPNEHAVAPIITNMQLGETADNEDNKQKVLLPTGMSTK